MALITIELRRMMMKKGKFKFLTLLNKYRSIKSEISYIKEVLDEAHKEFELYYRSWCIDNNVDIGELNKRNQRKIDMIFINEKSHRLKQELIAKEFSREKKEESKDAKDIFKLIARKLHPDTVSNDDPRKNEFEEDCIIRSFNYKTQNALGKSTKKSCKKKIDLKI